MAYEIANDAVKITLEAGADLSAKQYHLVKISSGKAALCAAATDVPIGVLQNKPASGQPAEIVVVGGTKIVQSASITAGALIGTDAAGKADAKVQGTDTTEYTIGQMLLNGGADGAIGTAVINCANAGRSA